MNHDFQSIQFGVCNSDKNEYDRHVIAVSTAGDDDLAASPLVAIFLNMKLLACLRQPPKKVQTTGPFERLGVYHL